MVPDKNIRPIDASMDPILLLKSALSRAELDEFDAAAAISPAASRAAYQLAAAVGFCRLLGRQIEEKFDGSLRRDMAIAAANELIARIERWTHNARDLNERWYRTPEPIEALDLCLAPLRLRMKAWAV